MDEFPYMCRGNKSIPFILQNLWDTEFKDSNVMIVLCGSAMSFIEKELLAEKNPLYGRATGIYKMNEMGFYDAARFFPDYSEKDKVLAYAVLGGIPHYLNQFNPKRSIAENITGMKEKANTNRGTYRLTNNFFRFWYAFGFANLSQLEDRDVEGVYEYIVDPALQKFASLAFEDVCREFVRELQKKNALPFRYTRMGRWMGKTTLRDKKAESGLKMAETEIDLLGIGKEAKEYLVGECKFRHSPFDYSEYLDTMAKLTPQKEKAKFYYFLFSESGFDDKITAETGISEKLYLYDIGTIVNLKNIF